MGSIATEAVAAGEHLGSRGIRATIAIVSSFNPDPSADLEEILSEFPHAVTVEAQTVSGGLAALVGTVVASAGLHCRVRALAVRHSPDGTSGGQVDRWRKHGLDRYGIVNAVLAALGISE
jgi:transketolase C-terminal domain/subunit